MNLKGIVERIKWNMCGHKEWSHNVQYNPGSYLAENGYAVDNKTCLGCGWKLHQIVRHEPSHESGG